MRRVPRCCTCSVASSTWVHSMMRSYAHLVHNRWNKLIIELTYLYIDARKRNVSNLYCRTKIDNFIIHYFIIHYWWHTKFWIANVEIEDNSDVRRKEYSREIFARSFPLSIAIAGQLFALAVSFRIDRFSRPQSLLFRASALSQYIFQRPVSCTDRACCIVNARECATYNRRHASRDAAARTYLSVYLRESCRGRVKINSTNICNVFGGYTMYISAEKNHVSYVVIRYIYICDLFTHNFKN